MQIRPADTRACNPDDGILRMQNFRFRFIVNANPSRSAKIHCKHKIESLPFLTSAAFFTGVCQKILRPDGFPDDKFPTDFLHALISNQSAADYNISPFV
jgi:hypothetical protein